MMRSFSRFVAASALFALVGSVFPSSAFALVEGGSFVTSGSELLSPFSFAEPNTSWRIDTTDGTETIITSISQDLTGPSDAGIEDTMGWSEVFAGNTDDGSVRIFPGFDITFNDTVYGSVYIGSNSYIAFGRNAWQYSNLSYDNPNTPAAHFCSGDHSYQRVLTLPGEGTMRVRYEGTDDTDGTLGDPNIVYEAVFYAGETYFDVHIGTNNGCSGDQLLPEFRGVETVGYTLTGSTGTWDYTTDPVTFTYEWQSSETGEGDWNAISGADALDYTLTENDLGMYVRLAVTETVGEMSETHVSDATRPISDVHEISTCEELMSADTDYGEESYDDVYKLTADIDCGEVTAAPLSWLGEFSGIFDGQEYTISHLTFYDEANDLGLFGVVHSGTIENVNIDQVSVTGLGRLGTVVGRVNGNALSMQNVHVTNASVIGYADHVGGLVGNWSSYNNYGITSSLTQSSYEGYVEGNGSITGGLVGSINIDEGAADVEVSTSYFDGEIVANGIAGGLIGSAHAADGGLQINEVYAKGSLNGDDSLGGLIGIIETAVEGGNGGNRVVLQNAFANMDISGGTDLGGLVGHVTINGGDSEEFFSYVSILSSYAAGTLAGSNNEGGLVGYVDALYNEDRLYIIDSFAASTFDAAGAYGGIVGLFVGGDNAINTNNVYYDSFATASEIPSGEGGGIIEGYDSIDGSEFPTYFYDNNAPIDEWDFGTVWYWLDDPGYPELQFVLQSTTVMPVVVSDVRKTSATVIGSVEFIREGEAYGNYGVEYTREGGEPLEDRMDPETFPVPLGFFSFDLVGLRCGSDYSFRFFLETEGPTVYSERSGTFTTQRCSSGSGSTMVYDAPSSSYAPTSSSLGSIGGSSGGSSDTPSTPTPTSTPEPTPAPLPTYTPTFDPVSGRNEAPDSSIAGPSPFTGTVEPISSVSPGWYIRGENYDTVYYVDANMHRHAFWDVMSFFTWANNWNQVVWVTDATLATLPLDSVMLPKPGVVLVKLTDRPQVYAIDLSKDAHDTLRTIPDEAAAISVFGNDWADYVIDLPPTIFAHYRAGTVLSSLERWDTSIMKKRVTLVP